MIRVTGDFDIVAVDPFRAELERAASTSREVIIDLRSLDFIDSSGLRAILDGHTALAAQGLRVILLKPPPALWRVFAVTGADRLLPFDDSRQADAGAPFRAEGS